MSVISEKNNEANTADDEQELSDFLAMDERLKEHLKLIEENKTLKSSLHDSICSLENLCPNDKQSDEELDLIASMKHFCKSIDLQIDPANRNLLDVFIEIANTTLNLVFNQEKSLIVKMKELDEELMSRKLSGTKSIYDTLCNKEKVLTESEYGYLNEHIQQQKYELLNEVQEIEKNKNAVTMQYLETLLELTPENIHDHFDSIVYSETEDATVINLYKKFFKKEQGNSNEDDKPQYLNGEAGQSKKLNHDYNQINLPRISSSDSTNSEEFICTLCSKKIDQKLIPMKCGHKYHYNCISDWLEDNEDCPCCD